MHSWQDNERKKVYNVPSTSSYKVENSHAPLYKRESVRNNKK